MGELSYWRWAGLAADTASAGASASAEAGGGVSSGVPGAGGGGSAGAGAGGGGGGDVAEGSAERFWFKQAAVAVHRYLLVTLVLMEGCGWATERSSELMRQLGAQQPGALRAALEGEAGVEERESASRHRGGGGGGGGGGEAAAEGNAEPAGTKKGKGKKGKKGNG